MAKYGGSDREAVVRGTHPVTKAPMPVRRRVGKRTSTTSLEDRKTGDNLSTGLTSMADSFSLADLGPLNDMTVGVEALPDMTILLSVDAKPDVAASGKVVNRRWSKPHGGMWSAPAVGELSSTWVEWCRSADYLPNDEDRMRLWKMRPSDATILKIDTAEKARRLAQEFEMEEESGEDLKVMSVLDFERLAGSGVDAIWVSEGVAADANRSMFGDDPSPFVGWDCESVLWLRPPQGTTFEELGTVSLRH